MFPLCLSCRSLCSPCPSKRKKQQSLEQKFQTLLLPPPSSSTNFFFPVCGTFCFPEKKKNLHLSGCDGILIAKCGFVRDCLYCKISYAALQTRLGLKGCCLLFFFFVPFFVLGTFLLFPDF